MLKIFPNDEELNRFAAEKFIEIGSEAVEERGFFTVALAGGSTPKSLYRLLASEECRNHLDWSSVFFFFGDERNVAPDNEESNFRMANENLFLPLVLYRLEQPRLARTSKTPRSPTFMPPRLVDSQQSEPLFGTIISWQTPGDAGKIAAKYEKTIVNTFNLSENEFPRFDLILLGMGADGHTASLFPFSAALKETRKIAVANPVEKLNTIRLTLTFPVINNAANVIFLVKGADKAETLREVLEGKREPQKYPSQSVQPRDGDLYWLIESEAAGLLSAK
jgi:6-phosphogluconolactonase